MLFLACLSHFFVFFSTSPHLTPFPPPYPSDTQKGICNISFSPHAMNMPISVCPSCFPVFPLGRHENASHMGRVFVSGYIPSPSEHQRTHLGALVLFGRFSTARHKKKSHMGHFFMSGYIPSPPEYHQHIQMGTLVVFGCLSSTPTPPSK